MMNSQSFHGSNDRPWPRRRRFSGSLLLAVWGSVLTFVPFSASAHPGHDLTDAGWKHVLLSPDHLSMVMAVGAALFVVGRWVQRRQARRVLQWGGASVAVASLVLWSVR